MSAITLAAAVSTGAAAAAGVGCCGHGRLPNRWVRDAESGLLVFRFRILTTSIYVYEAWEPMDAGQRSHSTLRVEWVGMDGVPVAEAVDWTAERREEGGLSKQWLGTVCSRALPADLDALPACTDLRCRSVGRWQAAMEQEALGAILRAFPEAAVGEPRHGTMERSFSPVTKVAAW